MKAVVQRVSRAAVRVGEETVSQIGQGLLVLLGIEQGDATDDIVDFAERLPRRRFFKDSEGKMNLSLLDISGEVLVVSQFTLAADLAKGLRPSFTRAMEPDKARQYVKLFALTSESAGVTVKEGVFGAHMCLELTNDGPVTFIFQSDKECSNGQ